MIFWHLFWVLYCDICSILWLTINDILELLCGNPLYWLCTMLRPAATRFQSPVFFISMRRDRRFEICAKMPTITRFHDVVLKWGSTSNSVGIMHSGAYLFPLHISLLFHMVKLPPMWRIYKQQRVKPIRDAIIFIDKEYRILFFWAEPKILLSYSYYHILGNALQAKL